MWDWQVIVGVVALCGTPWVVLAWIVRRVVRGDLISRAVHLDRVSDLKAAIAALDDTVGERDRQIAILLGKPVS